MKRLMWGRSCSMRASACSTRWNTVACCPVRRFQSASQGCARDMSSCCSNSTLDSFLPRMRNGMIWRYGGTLASTPSRRRPNMAVSYARGRVGSSASWPGRPLAAQRADQPLDAGQHGLVTDHLEVDERPQAEPGLAGLADDRDQPRDAVLDPELMGQRGLQLLEPAGREPRRQHRHRELAGR